MAARLQIVNTRIDPSAISKLRGLKYGPYLEQIIAPQMGQAFREWLAGVAKDVSSDWPRRSGKSAGELGSSSRVVFSGDLASMRGYFLVSQSIAANEYGTNPPALSAKNAKMIAIPILDGCFPDGRPKRLSPNSWRSLGSFIYKSKKNKNVYVAYKSKTDGKLKLLYLLVDAIKLKEMRLIRNAYDRRLPDLITQFILIMQDAVTEVYNQEFLATLDSIDPQLKVRRLPSITPSSELHGERLVPNY
jgi:hypothetical protein